MGLGYKKTYAIIDERVFYILFFSSEAFINLFSSVKKETYPQIRECIDTWISKDYTIITNATKSFKRKSFGVLNKIDKRLEIGGFCCVTTDALFQMLDSIPPERIGEVKSFSDNELKTIIKLLHCSTPPTFPTFRREEKFNAELNKLFNKDKSFNKCLQNKFWLLRK